MGAAGDDAPSDAVPRNMPRQTSQGTTGTTPRVLSLLGSVGWEAAGISGVDKTVGLNSVVVILKRQRDSPMPPADRSAGWKPDPRRRLCIPMVERGGWEEHVNGGEGAKPTQDWPLGQPAT
jgi:hypothetical protein